MDDLCGVVRYKNKKREKFLGRGKRSIGTFRRQISSGVTRVQLKPGQLTNATLITIRPMQFEFEIVTLLILAEVIFIISKEESWQLLLQLH